MRNKDKQIQPNNIEKKDYVYDLKIGSNTVKVTLQDVLYYSENGQTIMLDEVKTINMIEDIAKSLENNYTKYNPLPKRIVLVRNETTSPNGDIHWI